MIDRREFFKRLDALDGEAPKPGDLAGQIDFGRYQLIVGESAGTGWSTVGVRLAQIAAAFPPALFDQPARRAALEDAVVRRMAEAAPPGLVRLPDAGEFILPRSAVTIAGELAQVSVELQPAEPGAVFSSARLRRLFADVLPAVVDAGMYHCNHDEDALREAVDAMHTLVQVRQSLGTRGLVAFVGEGLKLGDVKLGMDDEMLMEFQVGDRSVRGMGVPAGLTVVMGDRYSGRVELMRALALGIYNRPHGHPHERLVTASDAVAVEAEPGRSVQRVDIRPFVRRLPGAHPERFRTDCADEFSSQAAATMEALEAGARTLLFEESSSSGEFLTGDGGFLDNPRVTPLCAQAESLVKQGGVSLVVAGSGATVAPFIAGADRVIGISEGRLHDVTAAAKAGAKPAAAAAGPVHESLGNQRWIVPSSIDPTLGDIDAAIALRDDGRLGFGREVIDASGLRQIASPHQLETIGHILAYARRRLLNEGLPLRQVLDGVDQALAGKEGLNVLTERASGRLARPRRFEIAGVLNRLRSLRVSHVGQ